MLRFTIRELCLLVLVIAVSLGWATDHRQMARDRQLWINYVHACCHRLEDHGESVFTRDRDVYLVAPFNSGQHGFPFWSVSKGILKPHPAMPLSTQPPSRRQFRKDGD